MGMLGAALWVGIAVSGFFALRGTTPSPKGWWLAAAVGLSLLGLHVPYVQLNDTYLVGLLPFAPLLPARLLAGVQVSGYDTSLPGPFR